MLRRTVLVFILIFVFAGSAAAQMLGKAVGPDSLSSALLPAFGYSSNEGVIGGIIYNRYDYQGKAVPFDNYLESTAVVSTKGFVKVQAQYEQTRNFGRDIRSIANLFFYRFRTDVFFGIGNNTSFTESRWNEQYYFFESVSFGLEYKLRKPIYSASDSRLDLQAGIATKYYIPYISRQSSSMALRRPNGQQGGWINDLKAGLVWENRDSEFDPRRGNRAEFETRLAPDFMSRFPLLSVRLEFRQYFELFDFLTIANRFEGRHVGGEVPFWEMSTLGDSYTLRGYPLNRFQGNSSLAYTLELRSWLLEFPEFYKLKIGGQLFTDVGRVFIDRNDINDLFQGYKQTVGVGGAMSIFNPDFIVRGEIGFSGDISRIYIGVGYLF